MTSECKNPMDQEEGPEEPKVEYRKEVKPGYLHINCRMVQNLGRVRFLLGELNTILTLMETNPNPTFADLQALIGIRKLLNEALMYEDKEPEYPNYSVP